MKISMEFIIVVMFKTIFALIMLNSYPAQEPENGTSTSFPLIESSEGALLLPRKGRLFCWVMTSEKFFDTRVPTVHETWLPRCDHGEFFTSTKMANQSIPFTTIFAALSDDYNELFWKTRRALQMAFTFISDDFDWYLKADDDTYIIVENLLKYLKKLDPKQPHYLGYPFKAYLKEGYNAGGGGYILSRGAMKIFAEKLANNFTLCPHHTMEDIGLARCLAQFGILPEDTRNENGQHRFFYQNINHHLKNRTWKRYRKYPEKQGADQFSKDTVSFHKLTPDEMRLYDILLYKVRSPTL